MKHERKHILFLLTYYYPHWTGLTQYARRLAEGLARKDYSVTVLTTQHEPSLAKEERIHGVQVIRKSVLFRLSRTLVSIQFVFAFLRHIQRNDVIVVYLPFAEVLLAAMVVKLFRKKLFLVHNGDLVLPKGLVNHLLEVFYRLSTGMAVQLSDGIVIQTEDYAQRSSFLKKYKRKWKVILPLYDALSIDKALLQRFIHTAKSTHSIGFAGRFVEEKGFDILLQAILHVVEKFPDATFVFAGDTNIPYEHFFADNKSLIEKNKKSLILLGKLDQTQVGSFYQLCDVFVISSRTDCFPSTEVEALLAGTPVVVTDIPGARWPVQQTRMGEIVQSENSGALAEGIITVLKHKKIYQKQYKKVKEIFDYEKTLRKYEELFI